MELKESIKSGVILALVSFGIHSMELKAWIVVPAYCNLYKENPFNGIESSLGFPSALHMSGL